MADDEVKEIDGVKRRPIPLGEGESKRSIPLASGAMGKMLYAKNAKDQLSLAVAGSGHEGFLAAAGIKTGAEADWALQESQRRQREERASRQDARPVKAIYARGQEFFDTKQNKKVVIIQANSTVTKKTKTPCHTVVDRKGNSWYAKETDLVPVPGR